MEKSGAYIDLLGVFLVTPQNPGRTDGRLRLGFYLAEQEQGVRIRVRDYERFRTEKYHYWMIPNQTAFNSGFSQFTWDATLATELGVGAEDLGVVAELDRHSYQVLVPVLLGAVPFPATVQAQGVRFVFVPKETVAIEYTISPHGQPASSLTKRTDRWIKDARSEVLWPGPGPGQIAADATYVLELKAKLTTAQGAAETIPLNYPFQYRPRPLEIPRVDAQPRSDEEQRRSSAKRYRPPPPF